MDERTLSEIEMRYEMVVERKNTVFSKNQSAIQ